MSSPAPPVRRTCCEPPPSARHQWQPRLRHCPRALLPLLWLSVIDHLTAWPTAERRGTGRSDRTGACDRRDGRFRGSPVDRLARSPGCGRGKRCRGAGLGAWTSLGVRNRARGVHDGRPGVDAHFSPGRLEASPVGLGVRTGGHGARHGSCRVAPPYRVPVVDVHGCRRRDGCVPRRSGGGGDVRRPPHPDHQRPAIPDTGLDLLLAFRGRPWVRRVLLVAVPVATGAALSFVEPIDWAAILRNLLVLLQAAIVFGLMLDATRRRQQAGVVAADARRATARGPPRHPPDTVGRTSRGQRHWRPSRRAAAAPRRLPRLGRLHQPGRSSARRAAADRFRLLPRAARRGSAHLEPRASAATGRLLGLRHRPFLATSTCLPVRDRQPAPRLPVAVQQRGVVHAGH